jgi:hypothetical protein
MMPTTQDFWACESSGFISFLRPNTNTDPTAVQVPAVFSMGLDASKCRPKSIYRLLVDARHALFGVAISSNDILRKSCIQG